MSYILDALLKADQERQRQALPGLNTLPLRPTASHHLLPWPATLLVAGLLAAVVVLAGLRAGKGSPPATPREIAPVPALPAMDATRPAASAPVTLSVEEATADVPAAPAPSPPQAAPLRRGASPEATVPRSEPDPRRLYRLAELPAGLQAEARQINIAGVAYAADAKERMAIINDRAWREGDEMTSGLKVESIASDGVVFNLKGYRFQKGGA